MKIYLISFIFCLSIMTMAQKIVGNGKVVTKERSIPTHFDGLKATGSIDVTILDGKKNGKIILEGESNVLDYVETKVEDGILIIQLKPNQSYTMKKGIRVSFPAHELNSIETTGSGDITSKGKLKSTTLSLLSKGSGDLSLQVDADKINLQTMGSGDTQLKGKTKVFEINSRGSGDLSAFDLMAQDIQLTKSGSGDCKVQLSGKLNVQSSGSGNVYYKGKADQVHANSRGSGKVIQSN